MLLLVPKVAMVHCNGIRTHLSENGLQRHSIMRCGIYDVGGTQTCQCGCLGFGDCVNVCEYDAHTL
ncbi:MAG: hypothetical protein ACLR13_07280 [Acutalibacteraceae bacterium]